jgi:hypothetical protein
VTGATDVLAQDPTFSRLDGIEWTPWRTILAGEETTGGNVIEIDPVPGEWDVRLALGSMAHEGIQATGSPLTKTGPAEWVLLDPEDVQVDARAAADDVGATGAPLESGAPV